MIQYDPYIKAYPHTLYGPTFSAFMVAQVEGLVMPKS